MNHICLVTDAWHPQVNGVVTTLSTLVTEAEERGYSVEVISPCFFSTFGLPTYNEIKVPWNWRKAYRVIGNSIKAAKAVHIATEGALGLLARIYCHRHNVPYLTTYHTKFPEYVKARWPFIPLSWGYKVMRWMHNRATTTLVTTASMKEELDAWGISNTEVWSRGVDTETFRPWNDIERGPETLIGYVGRVSVEKNIDAFLDLPDSLGKKVVVGDGPDLKRLKKKYPDVEFVGYKFGRDLVEWYNKLDCMVFPSCTDTFGLVNIEAMACGTPVAAYPVTGPKDIIIEGRNGAMSDDLDNAVKRALKCNREICRMHTVETFSWEKSLQPYLLALLG
jgi:glycosyltransferase involved in cell wall biosynthesis